MNKFLFSLIVILFISLESCKKEDTQVKELPKINDSEVPDNLKINQLQYLGSHNSYKKKTDQEIFDFLGNLANVLPAEFNPIELDYSHISLSEQLTHYGVRQLELDVYLDSYGGRFYSRKGYDFIEKEKESGIQELLEPGIKLLHIPDIDFNTHHYSFKSALKELKEWSENYPEHIPIFIIIELKSTTIHTTLPSAGFAETESWNNIAALNTLENEILSVFNVNNIITPDDIRGNYATLNEAVLNHNWPNIQESRGKVVFLFDNSQIANDYTANTPNLEGKLIFTNSTPGNSDAAFIKMNNIDSLYNSINDLAEQGYLIRTRVDEGTYQARNNDYSKWIKGTESGAHFLSTDYYKADDRAGDGTWSSYQVEFNNKLYKLNPFTN